jgi:hypothetical protein
MLINSDSYRPILTNCFGFKTNFTRSYQLLIVTELL